MERSYIEWMKREGMFSVDGYKPAEKLGQIILSMKPQVALDIGCGALPLPAYMKYSIHMTQWHGIDPFFNDIPRRFYFVSGIAEALPYRSIFDLVLFASSLEHVLSLHDALTEAKRVLKPDGNILIWFTDRTGDYIKRDHHMYDFLLSHILEILLDHDLEKNQTTILDGKETLVISKKAA